MEKKELEFEGHKVKVTKDGDKFKIVISTNDMMKVRIREVKM